MSSLRFYGNGNVSAKVSNMLIIYLQYRAISLRRVKLENLIVDVISPGDAQFDIAAPFSVCDGSRCTDLILASWSISRCECPPIISGSGTLITSTLSPSGVCWPRVS